MSKMQFRHFSAMKRAVFFKIFCFNEVNNENRKLSVNKGKLERALSETFRTIIFHNAAEWLLISVEYL